MGMRPLHRDPRHGQSRKPRHSPLPLDSQCDRRASLSSLEHKLEACGPQGLSGGGVQRERRGAVGARGIKQ